MERETGMEKGARTKRSKRRAKVKKRRRTRATTTTLVRRAAVTALRSLRWSTEVIEILVSGHYHGHLQME